MSGLQAAASPVTPQCQPQGYFILSYSAVSVHIQGFRMIAVATRVYPVLAPGILRASVGRVNAIVDIPGT